jgi:phosphoglycerate dehydrogenase-like enzyme
VLEFIRHPNGVWDFPGPMIDRLRSEFPTVTFSAPRTREEADRLLPEADIVLGWAVTRENFPRAARLRWIQVTAAGLGGLLFPEMVQSAVVVTNGRGLYGVPMAEHTIGVMLSIARKLHLCRDAQRERRWEAHRLWTEPPAVAQLQGATLGLVGLGSIGGEIARRARALGMRVLAVRRHPDRHDGGLADVQWGPEELPRLLEASDWVVLAAPLTAATRGLIGAEALRRMRPDAVLVNLGRGALVDEPALLSALRAGRIAGAALDVFAEEPLPAESPLWDLPQVLITPHVSGLGPRYWERATDLFAENLRRHLEGRALINVVDKQAGY